MADEIDWTKATFDGLRLAQHRAFLKLSFREKIERLEQMQEAEEALQRAMRSASTTQAPPGSASRDRADPPKS